MNQDQIAARWKQFAGAARDRWDKLSGDDLGALADSSRPAGMIQKQPGITPAKPNREADKLSAPTARNQP